MKGEAYGLVKSENSNKIALGPDPGVSIISIFKNLSLYGQTGENYENLTLRYKSFSLKQYKERKYIRHSHIKELRIFRGNIFSF